MALEVIDGTGAVLSAMISGELATSEVNRLQAAAVEAIRRCGRISALFILDDFRGWSPQGEWGDVTFISEHDEQIARIAVVGEERWRDLVYAFLAKGFRAAEVEYFLPGELDKARAWVEAANP
jgi:SpoIIAA-like